MIDLKDLRFSSRSGSVALGNSDEICFTAKAEKTPEYTWFTDGSFTSEGYFVLEYSTMGWERPAIHRHPCVTAFDTNGNKVSPITCDDLTADGRTYTVAVKMPAGTYHKLQFTFRQGKSKRITFIIHQLYTCSEVELPEYCAAIKTAHAEDLTVVDLSESFNHRFSAKDLDVKLGGGKFFTDENIALKNIPFKVKLDGDNCIAPPPPPAENEEIIDNFGAQAKRGLCRPISRDGETKVNLGGRKISEIFFLMAVEGRRYQRCGFATQTTILGAYGNEVTMPLLLDDVEDFAVETVYKDGRRDLSFPLNLCTNKHAVAGDLSLYAIPADGEAESVIFRNRHLDNDMSIVAVTVNETEKRLFPELQIPEPTEKVKHKADTERFVKHDKNRLTLKNGALLMGFDLSKGLFLDEFKNGFTPEFRFSPNSLIRIRCGNEISSDFKTIHCTTNEENAKIKLASGGLEFEITATLEGDNDILWNLNVINSTDEPRRQGIIFPYIEGIEYKNRDDGWYFVPKYQNINSNETVYIYEESAPSFPMQFMDVYSPAQQGGLALTTRERELTVRKYALEKYEKICFFVEYPDMYCEIGAGERFVCSPTCITAHAGDWRESYNIYKKWLDSWYEPYHCQDKQWYRECFWLLAEITDFFESKDIFKFPLWYDEGNKKFNYLEILEKQKALSGYYPDILHQWKWALRNRDGFYTHYWGNYSELEYSRYGGKESFRNALAEITEKTGAYTSLYLHPTLLTSVLPQFKDYEHLKVEKADGSNITIGDAYRMCHANDEWCDYILKMYPRVYEETKVPIMYVDEFSLRVENRCYGKDHGHEVPSNLLKTDRNFISRLKDVMPEEVILYGEYAAVDVNARYIDCNISYSIIDTVVEMIETAWHANDGDDRFSRVLTDVYRFAFPKIVQLNLPMAMRQLSWHPQKFIFFNGEAIYDSLWDLEESAGHEFICKAFGLKKKYADCFSSDYPETMIDTLSPAICMNKFPGKGRTVYTVYNRAYTTYRGKILRVKHTEGATYYDAWNDKPLKVEICDGYAEIYLDIHAQSMGCIVISHNQ